MTRTPVEDLTGSSTVIIGGGILGATILWELSSAGTPCALFEAGSVGHQSRGKSAAIVRMHYSAIQITHEQDVVYETAPAPPMPLADNDAFRLTYGGNRA